MCTFVAGVENVGSNPTDPTRVLDGAALNARFGSQPQLMVGANTAAFIHGKLLYFACRECYVMTSKYVKLVTIMCGKHNKILSLSTIG